MGASRSSSLGCQESRYYALSPRGSALYLRASVAAKGGKSLGTNLALPPLNMQALNLNNEILMIGSAKAAGDTYYQHSTQRRLEPLRIGICLRCMSPCKCIG
jgi:hypothetical protein